MRSSYKKLALGITVVLPIFAIYYQYSFQMSLQSIRNLNVAAGSFAGRQAIVVGGTSGIGHGIAVRLAEANYNVIIVGRDPVRGQSIVDEMKQKSTAKEVHHQFIPCDAFLLKNVQETTKQIQSITKDIDVLVLTQGMATIQGRTETKEGIDQKLALHYFSRMYFIQLLLPQLRSAAAHYQQQVNSTSSSSGSNSNAWLPPRVLSVLSAGIHSPFSDYKKDFELKDSYSLPRAADSAGFYNDVMLDAYSKQKDNQGITFIHAAPGFVSTNIGNSLPWFVRSLFSGLMIFARSIYDTAEYMTVPIFDKKFTGGLYLMNQNGQEASKTKLHDEAIDTVYSKTLEVFQRIEQLK